MKKTIKLIIGVFLLACFTVPAGGLALAEDSTLDQLKARNAELEAKNTQLSMQYNDVVNDRDALLNRLKRNIEENMELKSAARESGKRALNRQKTPDPVVLREKVKNTTIELLQEKTKNDRLEREAANTHYNLGVILQEQNKADQAIKEFEMALKTNPDDGDAHYNLALIYDKAKNNRELAIRHYDKYLKINPEAEDALKVKERLTDLDNENKIWGDPKVKGLGQKEKLGRP